MKKTTILATLIFFFLISIQGHSQCTNPGPRPTPFNTSFEDLATNPLESFCWPATGVVTYQWLVNLGPTMSTGTGPSGASIPSDPNDFVYWYCEASVPAVSGDSNRLESPLIDLTGLTNPVLSFEYHMYGADIDKLEIQIDDGTGFTTVESIIGQQQTSETDPWMTRIIDISAFSGNIKVGFLAFRGAGFEGDIAIDDIYIGNPTGIEENNPFISIAILPNPNDGYFVLTLNTQDIRTLEIDIIDVTGQIIYSKNSFDNLVNLEERFDLSDHPQGIYFVRITSDKGSTTKKVVVQ